MARESMIPVTNVGIWETGVTAGEKKYDFISDQRIEHVVEREKKRQDLIQGLKLGITIWGTLSLFSVSFWFLLSYFILS
jgi:hypothetical protein